MNTTIDSIQLADITSNSTDAYINHHRQGKGPSLRYDTTNHIQVLFDMHASVWM